jgi:hypothetical protein
MTKDLKTNEQPPGGTGRGAAECSVAGRMIVVIGASFGIGASIAAELALGEALQAAPA